MALYFKDSKIKKIFYGDTKIKKVYYGNTKIGSSGSLVSYYDGTTLLGQEEVDEGEDVLHPSLTIEKENYTLVGFSTTNGGERITTLNATGEPMNVYAIFVPNELTVASGYATQLYTYANTLQNTKYVTGTTGNGGGSNGQSENYHIGALSTFNIHLNEYAKADLTYSIITRGYNMSGSFDGSLRSVNDTYSQTITESGEHTIYASTYCTYGSYGAAYAGIDTLVLKNPIPWE